MDKLIRFSVFILFSFMVAEAFYCGVIGPCTRYSFNSLYALIPVLIVGLWLKFSGSTVMKFNLKIYGFLLGVMVLLFLMFFWISASRPKFIIKNSPFKSLAWATLINDRFSNESEGVAFYFEQRIKLEWGDSGRLFVGEKLKRNSPRERHLALKILSSVGPHENNKNDLIELLRKGNKRRGRIFDIWLFSHIRGFQLGCNHGGRNDEIP